jgi:hypothetical protein
MEVFLDENSAFCGNLRLILLEADCPEKCNYDKVRSCSIEKEFVCILECLDKGAVLNSTTEYVD